MKASAQLLSVVPIDSVHRVQGRRTVSFSGITVDILATRKIRLVEWRLRRFADPYWRLYWPLNKGGIVKIDDLVTSLKPGHVYLIPPHTVFSTELRKPFAKWYAHFKLGRLADRAAPGIYAFPATPAMKSIVEMLESQKEVSPFPWLTVEFVTQALRHLPDGVWSHHRLDARVLKALDFMSEHLAMKLTTGQIARHSGTSVRNLNHLFYKELQQSPMLILLSYRLDEACRLLRTSEASIEAIAEDCGLVNRHYFSRMLRQHRNTSPAVYRREQNCP